MLMAVKNQIKVSYLSFKYGIMREMLNKLSFVMNVLFMILNNASFILLWLVFYSLQDNIGGSTINDIFILWAFASGLFGVSHIFFENAFHLSEIINQGKLDAYLVQPKNVLIQAITGVSPSAFGDFLYAIILFIVAGLNIGQFLMCLLFLITGSCLYVSTSIIFNSLSFWFNKSDALADQANSLFTQFGIYPGGIFNNTIKILLYTVIPVGFTSYFPLEAVLELNLMKAVIIIGVALLFLILAVLIFYMGLRRYSSSNLMSARI